MINLIELTQNTIILTPNERLKRRLHALYGEQMQAKKANAWPTPAILSIAHWIQQLYEEAVENGLITQYLLSDIQYHMLGQAIGEQILKKYDFIQPRQTVTDMLKARQLLKQWRVNYRASSFVDKLTTEESRLFLEYVIHFDQALLKKNYLTIDELPDRLGEITVEKIVNAPKIILFAFDELTPQYRAFLDKLTQKKIAIEFLDWRNHESQRTISILPSLESEYRAMAQWAKNQLESGHQNIACIVPDLTNSRSLIARIFYEVFHPNSLFSLYADSTLFNISGGEPLSTLPLFSTLFSVLSLFYEQIQYHNVSQLILSPFLGMAESEKFSRIKLDLKLRDSVLQNLHYTDISIELLGQYAPHFSEIWQEIIKLEPTGKNMLPSFWMSWLTRLLKAVDWPGERTLNSYEYQQLQQSYAIFDSLVTLDDFCSELNYRQFVSLLKEMMDKHPFQIKTTNAPVQVLGMLEAAGNLFDCIWIAGLTDRVWPPVTNPNPYIPFEWQRQMDMPHASSQRQYDYSLTMMDGWVRAGTDVYFSYAEQEGDEPLSPSPLLRLFSSNICAIKTSEVSLAEQLASTAQPETNEESSSVPFHEDPAGTFGASLFEQQINCSFQAFAVHRLKSLEFKSPQNSWDPRLRGTHLHAVMERLWRRWQHSDVLHALDPEQLASQIDGAVTFILKKSLFLLYKKSHDHFNIEKKRFITIVSDWILFEKMRKPFKVAAIEYQQSCTLTVSDTFPKPREIKLNLRIDRIDLTDTGEWILIDYKTNEQPIKDWFYPIIKPQMPLYATQLAHSFAGITYACLHPSSQKMQFIGISKEDDLLPRVKRFEGIKNTEINSWHDLTRYWQEQLNYIAGDFIRGNAAVNPRSENSCHFCHLSTLCRIHDK